MNIIAINKNGYPADPLDIQCLVIALYTVKGHRVQDTRLAVNLIIDEVRMALQHNEDAEIGIGNYTFTFIKEDTEEATDEQPEPEPEPEPEHTD